MLRHRRDLCDHRFILSVVVAAVMLLLPAAAIAAPPANDNRTSAEPVLAFPATIQGSTVEATVERLDPQVSQCGRVESTVWYRIDQAPDGTVVMEVAGVGLAPVIRVYDVGKSSISELVCASAKAGASARVGFETRRGASYLVLVGKRPGTADVAFTLTARRFLPPSNDTLHVARGVGKLPATVRGSTLGATSDENDPDGCGLAGGTVWYSIAPRGAERLMLRLQTGGDLDATMAVLERVRSETRTVGCKATDPKGAAVLGWTVTKGATYLVVVGQRARSAPGDFTIGVLRAEPSERAPGKPLSRGSARGTLNGLTNVNDVWWSAMTPGITYKIALSSTPCVPLTLRQGSRSLRSLSCNDYTTFTPGPDGGGRYVFELRAPQGTGSASYRLRVVPATADDMGMGTEIRSLVTLSGALAPAAADVVDIYHFDVSERSDVRLRLASTVGYKLVLLTDSGSRLASGAVQLRRQLERGRYVVAVEGSAGMPGARYTLGLVIRHLTTTTLRASATEVAAGATVALTVATSPTPDSGRVKLQIDRFDPLGGWQFYRVMQLAAGSTTTMWTPPALGRWRVRATFVGTLTFSPSRSDYAPVLVAAPLPLGTS